MNIFFLLKGNIGIFVFFLYYSLGVLKQIVGVGCISEAQNFEAAKIRRPFQFMFVGCVGFTV